MIVTLSRVTTVVARIWISSTLPSVSPTATMSPGLTGRSKSKIKPETKLLAMFCNPNPIPTDIIPAKNANPVRLTPTIVIA